MSLIKKRKHVSKKNKKDWRKHCDIRDVEDFLEDQRLDERLGKFETKPDSELFVIDFGADIKKDVEEVKPLTAKARKRAALTETPKCFQMLLPTSKVPDPNAKRNHVNPFGTKPTALSKITESRKEKKNAYGKKLEQAKNNRKMAYQKKKKLQQTRQNFDVDLWGGSVPESKGIPESLVDDFIPPEAQLHNMLPEKRMRVKPPLPRTMLTRKAVEPPHPGISYNPTFQEHQELLQKVVVHERVMMKREAHLLRVTTGMFSKVTQKEKEDNWRKEMTAGLETKGEKTQDSESDSEYKAINPPVKNKKKDHKARRKQKERHIELERLKQKKINKKKISDIYKLRKLQSSILTKEQQQAKDRSERQSKRVIKDATALPNLSKHRGPIQEPEFVDPRSLSGDLRACRVSTSLLRDRYESLQRRGALAAAKIMMKKKRRVKSYFKAGHKVTDNDVERYMAKIEGGKVKSKVES